MGLIIRKFIFISLLFSSWTVTAKCSTTLGKIFTHDRGPSKTARLDEQDDFEYIKRAIEEFRESIPTYTGFALIDLVFEIFKLAFIFMLTFIVPPDMMDESLTSSKNFYRFEQFMNNTI